MALTTSARRPNANFQDRGCALAKCSLRQVLVGFHTRSARKWPELSKTGRSRDCQKLYARRGGPTPLLAPTHVKHTTELLKDCCCCFSDWLCARPDDLHNYLTYEQFLMTLGSWLEFTNAHQRKTARYRLPKQVACTPGPLTADRQANHTFRSHPSLPSETADGWVVGAALFFEVIFASTFNCPQDHRQTRFDSNSSSSRTLTHFPVRSPHYFHHFVRFGRQTCHLFRVRDRRRGKASPDPNHSRPTRIVRAAVVVVGDGRWFYAGVSRALLHCWPAQPTMTLGPWI